MADKGFEKTEGTAGGAGPAGEGKVQHDGAIVDEDSHGWAPDSGQASDNRRAGNKAHHPEEAAPRRRATPRRPDRRISAPDNRGRQRPLRAQAAAPSHRRGGPGASGRGGS